MSTFVSQEIAKQQMFRQAYGILESTVADHRFLALKASYVRMRFVNRHGTGFRPPEPSNHDFQVNWKTLYFCFCSTCICQYFHFLNISNISLSLCRLTWMSWATPTSCQLSSGMTTDHQLGLLGNTKKYIDGTFKEYVSTMYIQYYFNYKRKTLY